MCDQEVAMCDHFTMYDQEFHFNIFFLWCKCSIDYNDLQFHLIGHIMKHSALEIHTHLIKYNKRYTSAVKYVGKDFLSRKGQMLDDYANFMATEGNPGNGLSLYLTARMCCKHVVVIMKSSIWYEGKLDNREDFIHLSDVDLILVYLGKGVFRGTKPKPVLFHCTPKPELDSPSRKDEDYIPPATSKVYELESTLPQWHTRSMGSPTISSDTELASDSDSVHSQPQPTPEKSNPHQPRKPKAKQIVIKEKVYNSAHRRI